jgi:hypothetical protein
VCKRIQRPLLHFARARDLATMVPNTVGPYEHLGALPHTHIYSHTCCYHPIIVSVPEEEGRKKEERAMVELP